LGEIIVCTIETRGLMETKAMQVEKLILEGRGVRLEPLSRQHAAGLAEAISDGDLNKLAVTKIPDPNKLDPFFADADDAFAAGMELAFATVDKPSGAVAGSTRFRNIDVTHKRVEIGFTFLGKSWQRTHVNTEAKYLMLRHAFDTWGVNRVELLTDVLNAASRAAIARIGGKQEGVLRNHMVMRDGRVRDSVIFSIVKNEWPQVKAMLEKMLAANARRAGA
jgi:RimJ/RimL family protein N-acetyltransferase